MQVHLAHLPRSACPFLLNLENTERNPLPLKLDERTDCKFALPFNYDSDSTMNPGRFSPSNLKVRIGFF